MPNRIIKESVNESRGLSQCSLFADDFYKRLITYADDYGRFNADTEIMLARLYPRELSIVTQDDIIDALTELAGVGKIAFYTAKIFNTSYPQRGIYGCFPNWKEHQRVRESKLKCPDPDDTTINDWYLRRFIPIDMKAQIVERDGFKCKICGKFVTTCRDAKRFVKLGTGMYHIDHIVPCGQGGRATLENLQLTCPSCNLSRKKQFTFDEIVRFAESGFKENEFAASCGESRQNAAIIQSNPNPNPNLESECMSGAKNAPDRTPEITLTLNDKSQYPIYSEQIDEWSKLYPAVDVHQQLRNMKGWLDSNPTKRKTKSGILSFITRWLSKEQDSGKSRAISKNQSQSHSYNMDEFDKLGYDIPEV